MKKVKVIDILWDASCSCGHSDCDHESTHNGGALVQRKNKKPFEAYFSSPNLYLPENENEVDTTPTPGTRVRLDRNKWIK